MLEIKEILKMELFSSEMLEMILRNRSNEDGLISASEFPELIEDILMWHEQECSKKKYIDIVVKYA